MSKPKKPAKDKSKAGAVTNNIADEESALQAEDKGGRE